MPPKRPLLLCFDAFGTLFHPRRPVHQQYGEVARALGLSGFSDEDVQHAFKIAFKREAKANPNYGKANGLNAEKWWTNIIRNTFQPLVGDQTQLPSDLVPQLLHRFWSREGYTLYPDAVPLIQRVRRECVARDSSRVVIIGVITNSDDRVPAILTSLGLRVSPLRVGVDGEHATSPDKEHDIDFAVMSYDAGYEKPDRRIFDAAVRLAEEVAATTRSSDARDDDWEKIYVGDEYDKDVVGALNADWKAVLIDREQQGYCDHPKVSSLARLNEKQSKGDLRAMFATSPAVACSSLATLAEWIIEAP